MLLRELTRYYAQNRKVMPPSGWELCRLRWVIVISCVGTFCDIQDLATCSSLGGIMTYVPRKTVRTRDIRGFQLWDHAGYVLGVNPKQPERAISQHEDFVSRCQFIANETGDVGAEAVAKFIATLSEQNIDHHPSYKELLKSGIISFRVETDNIFVFDRPAVHQWLSDNPLSSGSIQGQCMICGEWGNIEKILPTIKGIRGSDPIGVRLTAINNIRTGHSCLGAYGLTQGFSAPTCEKCSHQYGNALNYLLRESSYNKIHIGLFTLVFWCPQGREVELLLRKIILGGQDTQQIKDENGNVYLNPNPRKLYWVPEPAGNVVEHLKKHYRNGYINVVVFRGKERRIAVNYYQRIQQTELIHNLCYWLRCTAKQNRELMPLTLFLSVIAQNNDLENLRSSALLSFLVTLLNKRPISSALMRVLAGYTDSKLNFSPLHEKLVNYMSSLLPEDHEKSKPFLCGKLIALLVKCQEEANGEASTIRCDAVTVTAPARKIALYLKKNRHHLNLIGKQSYGRRVNLEKEIQKIIAEIFVFPEILDSDEQLSLLSGYYCMRNDLFTSKRRYNNACS